MKTEDSIRARQERVRVERKLDNLSKTTQATISRIKSEKTKPQARVVYSNAKALNNH